MKITKFYARINTNNENHKILCENLENNENLKITRENYQNYENI